MGVEGEAKAGRRRAQVRAVTENAKCKVEERNQKQPCDKPLRNTMMSQFGNIVV